MNYQKPQFIVSEDTSEGVYMASGATGSGCSYGAATITFNEEDYNNNKFRVTVKAPHQGTTNDKKGQKTELTFSVPVRNLTVENNKGSVNGSDSGTQITITASESHHTEYNLQIVFQADSKPDIKAVVTPL